MKLLLFTCPACGFLMFVEPPGSYDICHICGWEDDHVQLRFPLLQGGANKESLWEAQTNILQKFPLEIKEYQGYKRDSDWRPLDVMDTLAAQDFPRTGQDYFNEAKKHAPIYYWKRGKSEDKILGPK